jgi:hypothetical protein
MPNANTPRAPAPTAHLREFLSYEAMRLECDAVKATFPSWCTVETKVLGHSEEGRELVAFHVWPRGKGKAQPTLWVDANMHAGELVGTNVVVAQFSELARLLTQGTPAAQEFRDVNYVFLPRVCPDGAECAFSNGLVNRSNPRDARAADELGPHWKRTCLVEKRARPEHRLALLQSPRRVGVMRRRNAAGVWTMDDEHPALLRRRTWNDKGPFFDVFPEGRIENFDGVNVPPAHRVDRNETDLNRNFPYLWESDRPGHRSGRFPGSEPESRALIEYSSRLPQIYFWMNYHTFGGVYIRPPEDKPDSSLPRLDASIYEALDAELERLTGYPAVSGYSEFLYEPGVPLPGTLSDWAYFGLGAYSYVCELWDLPARLGRLERPFIKRYAPWSTEQWRKLFLFDKNSNGGLLFGHPWLPYEHPQLGAVEVSELPAVFGIQNPPQSLIEDVIAPQLEVFRFLVRIAPRTSLTARVRSEQTTTLTLANEGFLPSFISKQKNKAFGPQSILVHGAKATLAFDDLDGYAPLNTGWLDFAANGSGMRTSFQLDMSHADFAQEVRVVFPRGATHVLSRP